jgi:hypothetical protein
MGTHVNKKNLILGIVGALVVFGFGMGAGAAGKATPATAGPTPPV